MMPSFGFRVKRFFLCADLWIVTGISTAIWLFGAAVITWVLG